MSNLEIEVLELRHATEGNLRAYAVVRVGEITICDCRVIQQPGSRAYVSGPQRQVGSRYYPLVKMSPGLRQLVQGVVLEAAKKDGFITEI